MTDPILVLRKLATLHEHVVRARRRRPVSLEALETDVDLQDALAMSLLVAIQVISTSLASELSRGVGLRNRIAHGYASLDLDRIWSELPAGLDAMDRYANAIARFVA